MSAIVDALLTEMSDADVAALAERLRPHLDRNDTGSSLLAPKQAAERLGIHPKTLTRAAAAGRVPGAVRIGRSWRFRADGLLLDPPISAAPASPVILRAKAVTHSAADAIRTGASAHGKVGRNPPSRRRCE